MEPEQYLGPKRYKYHYRCEACGHEYSKICTSVPKVDPKCPNKSCSDKAKLAEQEREIANLKRMLESGQAPVQIGHKTVVKAIDETASIVMQDYGLTNLRDNVGPGEAVAPKLPPAQQAAADGYFNGGAMKRSGITSAQANLLGRRAMAGAFRNMAVPPTVVRPQAQRGESPLTRVGIEKLK